MLRSRFPVSLSSPFRRTKGQFRALRTQNCLLYGRGICPPGARPGGQTFFYLFRQAGDVYKRQVYGGAVRFMNGSGLAATKKPKNGAVCKEERLCVDNLTRWKIRYRVKLRCIRARQLEVAAAQGASRGKYPGGILKRAGEGSDLSCMGKRTCDG